MTAVTSTVPIWLSALLLLASASASSDGVLPPTPGPILSECVQSCVCYPKLSGSHALAAPLAVIVECSNAGDLPPIYPAGTTVLRFTDSRVPALRAQLHHAHLAQLHDLVLARDGIREVAVDAFRRLTELKEIDMSDNALDALSAEHFVQQRNLKLLILTGNPGLDCVALRREMAAVCVKCDADDAPCERTTRGTTSAAVAARSPRPEIDANPSGTAPAEPAPETVSDGGEPSTLDDPTASAPPAPQGATSAWGWVGLGAIIGALFGAVMLAVAWRLHAHKDAQTPASQGSAHSLLNGQ